MSDNKSQTILATNSTQIVFNEFPVEDPKAYLPGHIKVHNGQVFVVSDSKWVKTKTMDDVIRTIHPDVIQVPTPLETPFIFADKMSDNKLQPVQNDDVLQFDDPKTYPEGYVKIRNGQPFVKRGNRWLKANEMVRIIHPLEITPLVETPKGEICGILKAAQNAIQLSNVDPNHVMHPNPEEQQYLDCIRDVLETGIKQGDRTGVGTLSKFGRMMRFSLRNGRIPVPTTKDFFWRGCKGELKWMLKGQTDAKILSEQKIHIWDGNTSRKELDKRGFKDYHEGECGPIYGWVWRHFGANYVNCKTDYKGEGFDQIAHIVKQLKTNPDSRQILLTSLDPSQVHKAVLPPCHVLAQFVVFNGELSCHMTQRSCDVMLGVPFNIVQYALLTHLLADFVGLKPGELVYSMGHYHIYLNHLEGAQEQLKRTPTAYPTLQIKSRPPPNGDLSDYDMKDVVLINYKPQAAIKMEMAV